MASVVRYIVRNCGSARRRKFSTGLEVNNNLSGDELLLRSSESGTLLMLAFPYFVFSHLGKECILSLVQDIFSEIKKPIVMVLFL